MAGYLEAKHLREAFKHARKIEETTSEESYECCNLQIAADYQSDGGVAILLVDAAGVERAHMWITNADVKRIRADFNFHSKALKISERSYAGRALREATRSKRLI